MNDCGGWSAWRNEKPGSASIHVQGQCTFPQPGYKVELQRLSMVAKPSDGPFVKGPVYAARGGAPPVFEVASGDNPFFALEVATGVMLFDSAQHASERNDGNFYATWSETALLSGSEVALPQQAWQSLNAADFLFYRVVTSQNADTWAGAEASVSDQNFMQSPFIILVGSTAGLDDPSCLVLVRVVTPPRPGSPLTTQTVQAAFMEQTSVLYQSVTILPEGTSVDVELVF